MVAKLNFFRNYPADVWIETGTYMGDGISQALLSGYDKIISIELSDYYYNLCKEKFKGNEKVDVINGKSFKQLELIFNDSEFLEKKIVFWLDAHYSACGTAGIEDPNPLMKELNSIKDWVCTKMPKILPTIIIDDLRTFGKQKSGFDTKDIVESIKRISSKYEISFHDGCNSPDINRAEYIEFKDDILVATPNYEKD